MVPSLQSDGTELYQITLLKGNEMYLLGIAGQVQDASVALLKDGEIVAAAEEERFSRLKFMGMMQCPDGIPHRALQFCLDRAGIGLQDVDHLCYFFRPYRELASQWLQDLTLRAWRSPKYALFSMFQKAEIFKAHLKSVKRLQLAGGGRAKLHFVEHHKCHVATCHFLSGLDESASLVVDAIGEHASTSWFHCVGTEIRRLRTINYPDSLGMLYAQITRYLGFTPWADEYKVMGLASFGRPEYLREFRDIVRSTRNGGYRINRKYLNRLLRGPDLLGPAFYQRFGPAREPRQLLAGHFTNVAASLQARLEEVALEMAGELYRRTRAETLCVSGGVALNCSMNGKLAASSSFKRVIAHNSSGDAGTSLGAALHVWHSVLGNPIRKKVPNHGYLGPSYDDGEIAAALTAAKCSTFEHHDEEQLLEITANAIAAGEIVGWFQGGMEWGPRALGARSILADATNPAMKDILNKWVKHREEFRPFAPAVLEEYASEYFDCDAPSPYMTVVYHVREGKKALIPAVTHVNGTARVQTVGEHDHPRFYRLLRRFHSLTGVPVVVNTSFNVMGEPIVCTPADAIRCFFGTGIDRLVIGNYVVTKATAASLGVISSHEGQPARLAG